MADGRSTHPLWLMRSQQVISCLLRSQQQLVYGSQKPIIVFFMTAMKSASHLTVAKKVNISLFIAGEKVKIIRWQRS